MIYFSVTGLVLDLIGVSMLGIDLIRVQHRLRTDAEERLSRLDAILEEIGGIDAWAETVPDDFREWQWEEGRTVLLDGTFDPRQAQESFKAVLDTIGRIGTHVLTLARMQTTAIEADRTTASLSLRYSYICLTTIAIGFVLQLVAYL